MENTLKTATAFLNDLLGHTTKELTFRYNDEEEANKCIISKFILCKTITEKKEKYTYYDYPELDHEEQDTGYWASYTIYGVKTDSNNINDSIIVGEFLECDNAHIMETEHRGVIIWKNGRWSVTVECEAPELA